MPNGKTAIVTDLGELFTVRIDPTWRYRHLWGSPLGQKLSATFFDFDDGISESASVDYCDTSVIGRAEQFKTYTGTGNREVTLAFKFRAQGLVGGGSDIRAGGAAMSAIQAPLFIDSNGVETRDNTSDLLSVIESEVVQPAKFLDALKFPLRQDNGISVGPPRVLLTIGRLLTMRAIVTAAQLDWKAPFDPDTLLPYGAEVNVTFTSVYEKVTEYNFNGPQRWQGYTPDPGGLGGIDGPANPFSNLGLGISGTPASNNAQA